ncbi:MAG: metallophosphoesterase [Candidatus Thermoplasmatota archaeon]
MRIYAAADIHGAQYRLNLILNNIQKYAPDLMIICGDITQFGPADVATNFLNQLPLETLALHGNIDTPDVPPAITNSKAINIDRTHITIKNQEFIGIGGDLSEPFTKTLIHRGKKTQPLNELITKKTILVTHVPPYGFQDTTFLGHHIGNKELKEVLETYEPFLIICGHVHEDPGYTTYKNTTIVNCSLGKKTEGALIDINDAITVQLLE